MPKVMEDRLKRIAAQKKLSKEGADKFVFGTMRKTGWKPSQQKGVSNTEDKDKSAKNYVIKGRLLKNFKR